VNDIPDERGVSPVAPQRRWLSPKARRIALLGGAGGAVGLVAIGINSALHDKGPAQKPIDTGSTVIAQVTRAPAPPPPPPQVVQEVPKQPPVVRVHEKPVLIQAPPVVAQRPHYVVMPAESGEGEFEVAEGKKPSTEPPRDNGPAAGGGPVGANTTQVAFKAATLPGAKAGPAIRLTYVMMPQLVPCALETAMDSTVAGFISCHTTQDVLSPDNIVLMPAGTRFSGTYKNDIHQGQNRLFSFVGYGITPDGIPVPLDAQVADGMGRAGIPGEVDSHFWSRFGAGILLAGSQSALQLAQAMVSKGGNSYFSLNSGSATDVATEILRQQEQQPPTISVQPGTLVSLVVDHPIDFSDALKVRPRE
jgi:type IV secretion system protein VirB10